MFIAEVFVRLTIQGKSKDVPFNSGRTFDEVFAAAHSRADGAWPKPLDFEDKGLWSDAIRLRQAEDELSGIDSSQKERRPIEKK